MVTTGGTGPAQRDVTPEATEAVCEKMMPGFGELMRQGVAREGADRDPVAADRRHPRQDADRQPAGQAGARSASACCAVFPAIPYCIDLIGGPYLTTNEARIVAFRPKK